MSDIDPKLKQQLVDQVAKVQKGFTSGKLLTKEQRLDQLRNLYYGLLDKAKDFDAALLKDLNRCAGDNSVLEMQSSLREIQETIDNLGSWMKDKRVWTTDLRFTLSVLKTQHTPFGTVLIISPWNYPLYLSFPGIAAAIAAGNTVVLKPSELTPSTSRVMKELVEEYLDPEVCQVVEGAVAETTVLLNDVKFDKIMFTGSTSVGKIVAKAAAKTLTPVLLELGGKSPGLVGKVSSKSSLDVMAKRLIWAKFTNSGQTCVAPDYVLVEKSTAADFKKALIKWAEKFYGEVTEESHEGWVDAPAPRLAKRLRRLIAETHGTVVFGHQYTEKELDILESDGSKFVNPVIVAGIDKNSLDEEPLMQDELFGPILPIIEVDDITGDALDIVNRPSLNCPLALYVFSDDSKAIDYIGKHSKCGGFSVNDGIMHVACTAIPFGGIGNSGMGCYHSIEGFQAFSHTRAYFQQPFWIEFLLGMRYPPSTVEKAKMGTNLALSRVWFPRTGPVKKSLLARILPIFLSLATGAGLLFFLLF